MDYTQVVAEGDLRKLKEIAELIITQYPCKVISQPSPGMVMIKHVDPLEKTPFYIGEAYVTQCEVEINKHLGYGCVLGHDARRALYGAMIDACLENSHPLADQITLLLDVEYARLMKEWQDESRQTASTKVNFDVKKG